MAHGVPFDVKRTLHGRLSHSFDPEVGSFSLMAMFFFAYFCHVVQSYNWEART